MTTTNSILDELLTTSKLTLPDQPFDRQAFAVILFKAVDEMPEDDWSNMSEPAQAWSNAAAKAKIHGTSTPWPGDPLLTPAKPRVRKPEPTPEPAKTAAEVPADLPLPFAIRIARNEGLGTAAAIDRLELALPILVSRYAISEPDLQAFFIEPWASLEHNYYQLADTLREKKDEVRKLEREINDLSKKKSTALRLAYEHIEEKDQTIKDLATVAVSKLSRRNSLDDADEEAEVDRSPPFVTRRAKPNKKSTALVAERILVDKIASTMVSRNELMELMEDKKPGFTDWIKFENAGDLQGYSLRKDKGGAAPKVWYDRVPAIKALIRLGYIGN